MQNETVLYFSYSAGCGRKKKQAKKKTTNKQKNTYTKIKNKQTKYKKANKSRETEFFVILLFIKQLRTYKNFISLTGNSNSTHHICYVVLIKVGKYIRFSLKYLVIYWNV